MADNASNYPGAIDTFTARAATMNLAAKHSDDHDKLRDAVIEIETELGTAPSGASATVAARFATVLPLAGGTMTGAITLPNASPATDNIAARKKYVDDSITANNANYVPISGGASMSGQYIINGGASVPLILRKSAQDPSVDFHTVAGARLAILTATTGGLLVHSESDVAFASVATERMRLVGSALIFGKTTSDLNSPGIELYGTGASQIGSTRSTTSAASIQNFYCRHMNSADAGGEIFIHFTRTSAGTVIGSISQNSTTGTLYNVTSDARLKTDVGLTDDDGLATVLRIPVRRYQRVDGSESVGVFAQELVDVIPQAVTEGGDDPDTEPWQVDYSQENVIGHLLRAVQQLEARVAELEAA